MIFNYGPKHAGLDCSSFVHVCILVVSACARERLGFLARKGREREYKRVSEQPGLNVWLSLNLRQRERISLVQHQGWLKGKQCQLEGARLETDCDY